MTGIDTKLHPLTSFLVRLLLRPKLWYEDPSRQKADSSWVHDSIKVLKGKLPFQPGAALLASMAGVPVVMVYVDGPVKILGKRAQLMVSVPFRLEQPSQGLNSEYILVQTQMLQDRMKILTEEFTSVSKAPSHSSQMPQK